MLPDILSSSIRLISVICSEARGVEQGLNVEGVHVGEANTGGVDVVWVLWEVLMLGVTFVFFALVPIFIKHLT